MSDDQWFAVVGIFAAGGTVVLCLRWLWWMRKGDDDEDGMW